MNLSPIRAQSQSQMSLTTCRAENARNHIEEEANNLGASFAYAHQLVIRLVPNIEAAEPKKSPPFTCYHKANNIVKIRGTSASIIIRSLAQEANRATQPHEARSPRSESKSFIIPYSIGWFGRYTFHRRPIIDRLEGGAHGQQSHFQ